jgi:hypothetical protein
MHEETLSHRAARMAGITLTACIAVLALPHAARAAAPVCDTELRQFPLPAGLTGTNPPPPCTDADGDALTIEVVQAPTHGTLDPAGSAPAETPRRYTADPNADPDTVDTMTFRAVDSNGDASNDFGIEVTILAPDEAPVCDDLDLTVESGQSLDVPFACTDPDGPDVTIAHGTPAHGTLTGGRYSPAAGFTGTDTISYTATDSWGVESDAASATITVTPAPEPPAQPQPKPKPKPKPKPQPLVDRKAPSLTLSAPASLSSLRRAFQLTATTDEAGRLTIDVFVSAATARRYGIDKHATARVRVATLERDVAAGTNAVKLKLSRKARKRLKHATDVKLRVFATITDAAGNDRTRRTHITGQP